MAPLVDKLDFRHCAERARRGLLDTAGVLGAALLADAETLAYLASWAELPDHEVLGRCCPSRYAERFMPPCWPDHMGVPPRPGHPQSLQTSLVNRPPSYWRCCFLEARALLNAAANGNAVLAPWMETQIEKDLAPFRARIPEDGPRPEDAETATRGGLCWVSVRAAASVRNDPVDWLDVDGGSVDYQGESCSSGTHSWFLVLDASLRVLVHNVPSGTWPPDDLRMLFSLEELELRDFRRPWSTRPDLDDAPSTDPGGMALRWPVFVGARLRRKRSRKHFGDGTVLVPYFMDDSTQKIEEGLDASEAAPPWDNRLRRIFWRGQLGYGVGRLKTDVDYSARVALQLKIRRFPQSLLAPPFPFSQSSIVREPRTRLVAHSLAYPDEVDARLTSVPGTGLEGHAEFVEQMIQSGALTGRVPSTDLVICGYGAIVEGIAWATNEFTVLAADVTPLKTESPLEIWYSSGLRPWLEYVPLDLMLDEHSLRSRLQFLRENHAGLAKFIANKSSVFAQDCLQQHKQFFYLSEVLRRYASLFRMGRA